MFRSLEAEAAKRRLTQLFHSEQLGRENHRSTPIVTHDSSRAARTDTKQISKSLKKIVAHKDSATDEAAIAK
jgi:hypothetical protein